MILIPARPGKETNVICSGLAYVGNPALKRAQNIAYVHD
jgi:hypothetical protein